MAKFDEGLSPEEAVEEYLRRRGEFVERVEEPKWVKLYGIEPNDVSDDARKILQQKAPKFDNKIHYVESLEEILVEERKGMCVIYVDGADISDYWDFVAEVREAFDTPDKVHWLNVPGNPLVCWITELDWLTWEGNDHFMLIINHWNQCMKRNPEDKQDILRELEYVCTYWSGKDPVNSCIAVSFREPMWFQVYLVQGKEEESQNTWDKIKDFITFKHRI